MSDRLLTSQFLSLLRSGLWHETRPELSLFDKETDWNGLFQIAKQQTVAAIIWDGIEKLPSAMQPPRSIRLEWYAYLIKIEKSNQVLNQVVVEIFEKYRANGVRCVLLKGQGLATLYGRPLHRGCGDIDIYVDRENYEVANRVIRQAGATDFLDLKHHHHSHMKFRGVSIENHHRLTDLFTKRATKQLQKITPKDVDYVSIDGREIAVLPKEFNSLYVFLHLYRHFFTFGIGLRQVCDWVMVLNSSQNIRPELLGHNKVWNTLGQMCVDHLGLSAAKVPYYKAQPKHKSEKMLEMILAEGNFGFNNSEIFTARPKKYISGKIFSLCKQVRRWIKLLQLFPRHTISYIFVYKPLVSIRQIKSEKF